MRLFFLKILEKFGIDGAVAYTVIGRLWQGGASLITIFLITRFFSPIEQGFYFTFSSIVALQVFVELGFSVVIIQFASHEHAHLRWAESGVLVGPEQFKDRLISLMQLALKWYGIAAILMVILLSPGGYLFFLKQQAKYVNISWQSPWFCLVLFFAIFFCLSPLLSFLEGCGKIKDVAKMRFVQDLIANLLLWGGCFCKLGLWVASLFYVGKILVILLWIGTDWRKSFFLNALKTKPQTVINWRREIFPFQWKIALSWISGFFVFQLFNPILFNYHGAIIAGQMGLSLTVCNGITVIAMSWVNAKVPVFSNLVAKKEYAKLDNLFFRILKQSFVVTLFLILSFIIAVCFLRLIQWPLESRFLPILPLLLLSGTVLVNQVNFTQAAYLRAHKREPLLVSSVVMAGLMCVSTYFLGRFYSAIGVTLGYFVLMCFGLAWVAMIFLQKRKLWHS